MAITIITLYDDERAEHYVGAVDGELSKDELLKLASKYNAVLDGEDGSHEDEGRTLGWRVVELATPNSLAELLNIWPDGV